MSLLDVLLCNSTVMYIVLENYYTTISFGTFTAIKVAHLTCILKSDIYVGGNVSTNAFNMPSTRRAMYTFCALHNSLFYLYMTVACLTRLAHGGIQEIRIQFSYQIVYPMFPFSKQWPVYALWRYQWMSLLLEFRESSCG